MATILVVDDSPVNREFLGTLLAYHNHRVVQAIDGAVALAMMHTEHPDLVISDILMPTMDGFELVRRIRMHPDFSEIPVIFRTQSYREREAISLAESCGVDCVITDPGSPELVMGAVKDALKDGRSRRPKITDEKFGRSHIRLVGDKLAQTDSELRWKTDRLAAVIDANITLSAVRDPQELLDIFCRISRDLLSAKYVMIAMLDIQAVPPISETYLSGYNDIVTNDLKAALRNGAFLIDMIVNPRRVRCTNPIGAPLAIGLPSAHPPIQSMLAAPIQSPAKVHGWICMTEKVGLTEFTDEDERVLSALAALVGRLYETDRLHAELTESEGKLRVSETQLNRLAYHDSLTGLPNRPNVYGRLEQALSSARRSGDRVALISLDLDHFKNVNDTLGHAIGDGLLQEVANRLSACTRESDVVARLGGDEFVVMLSAIKTPEGAVGQADKILAAFGEAFAISGHELIISPSIGITVFPEDGATVEDLMKNADAAMYFAKAAGRDNFQFFTASMNKAVADRVMFENALRQGLARQEFELHYQPIIEVGTNRTSGFEALVRWNHPEKGIIFPEQFIPIAEDTGLIKELGIWVLRDSLRQLRIWRNNTREKIQVTVNVSVQQLRSRDFPALVGDALDAARVGPDALELEITESAAMQHPEETIKVLVKLREMGVDLAIDAFGTGYSSLNYLKLLPINRLKVDQSFVRDIESDPNDAAICSATIALAHSLGLNVTAVGVETPAQHAYLKMLGSDFMQGFLFSKPVPSNDAFSLVGKQFKNTGPQKSIKRSASKRGAATARG